MDKRSFVRAAASGALCLLTPALYAQQAVPSHKYSLQGIDAEGKKLNLTDFNDHTLLVSFFTAGCNLCLRDLKLMREFYVNNAKRKFILLAVNVDEQKSDFDDYNKLVNLAIPKGQRFPMVWRNAPDHKDNFGAIVKQPTHFVLGKQQQLVLRREGTFQPADWDNLWESLDS